MKPVSAINTLPPVILAVFGVMVALEALFGLADLGLFGLQAKGQWRFDAAVNYGFRAPILEHLWHNGPDLWLMKNFFTYIFVSSSTLGALFGAVLLLALGKFVGDAVPGWGLAAILLVSAGVGAAVFGLFAPPQLLLIGMYPAAYGLIGAYTYLLWLRLGQMGESRVRAFQMIGALLAIQLVYGVIFGGPPTWIAEITGFVAGGLTSVLVVPGGLQTLRARLQARR